MQRQLISFKLSEVNNAFGIDVNTSQTHTITGTETFTVPTRAPNGIDDGTSSITATLELGTGGTGLNYRLADNPDNTATVTVTNESRPVLSVTADTQLSWKVNHLTSRFQSNRLMLK